jgi:hypothetical protein
MATKQRTNCTTAGQRQRTNSTGLPTCCGRHGTKCSSVTSVNPPDTRRGTITVPFNKGKMDMGEVKELPMERGEGSGTGSHTHA